jgi:carboxymethylenebutenolidase
MGEMVRYPVSRGSSEGYLATPPGDPGPGVIVIHECWGLVPHIRTVADRLAEAGFAALAPDLYHGAQAAEPIRAGKLLMGMAMDRAAEDLAGAAGYLADLPAVDGGIGTVGFGAGGSLALWSATLSDRIAATVAFYPTLPWERMRPDWSRYAGRAAVIHASAEDSGIPAAKRAIEEAGGTVTLYDYPGTGHAFFDDDRPEVFDRQASATAWARTLELFRTRLA